MRRQLAATILALNCLWSQPMRAQSREVFRDGSALRIETTTDRLFQGTVLTGARDSIRLRQDIRDSVIVVPVADVRSISVLRANRGRGAKRGLLLGSGVALALTAALTAANAHSDEATSVIGLLLALPATLLGGGIGAGIGAALATPEWSAPVQLHADGRRRASLAVRYRF